MSKSPRRLLSPRTPRSLGDSCVMAARPRRQYPTRSMPWPGMGALIDRCRREDGPDLNELSCELRDCTALSRISARTPASQYASEGSMDGRAASSSGGGAARQLLRLGLLPRRVGGLVFARGRLTLAVGSGLQQARLAARPLELLQKRVVGLLGPQLQHAAFDPLHPPGHIGAHRLPFGVQGASG